MSNDTGMSWQQRNARNVRRLGMWTAAWLVSLAAVFFGHKYLWDGNQALTAAVVGINVVLGGFMIWANKQHLLGLDELQRKMQLEAMGLSLGVGMVLGFAYSALDSTGVIPFRAEISHLAVIMSLSYLIGLAIGVRKYQ